MKKQNHLEVSDGETNIVSYRECPLKPHEVEKDQIFNDTICCRITGQGKEFICPKFYKSVYGSKGFQIDCR